MLEPVIKYIHKLMEGFKGTHIVFRIIACIFILVAAMIGIVFALIYEVTVIILGGIIFALFKR